MPTTFNSPPGWPSPPAGWRPPEGWRPQDSWPAAPEGWQFWVETPEPVVPVELVAAPGRTFVPGAAVAAAPTATLPPPIATLAPRTATLAPRTATLPPPTGLPAPFPPPPGHGPPVPPPYVPSASFMADDHPGAVAAARRDGKHAMLLGGLWCGGGLAATATVSMVSESGRFFWGAVLFGLVRIVQGAVRYARAES